MSETILRLSIPFVARGLSMMLLDDDDNVRPMKYVSDWFDKVFKEVEREKDKLISNLDIVRTKVEAIDHKTEKVDDVVFEWQKEAEILLEELENKTTIQARKLQWNEFRKLLKKITAQNVKCDQLDPFSTPIPSLKYFSSGNIEHYFKSMIGLYGRQGSGKTTLVNAMGEKVKYLNIFFEVLFATVTKNPNIKRMQKEIADTLNMSFDKNSEAGRAKRILETIESRTRSILVIFDNVQAKFDPKDVGIPCNSNRCKILLTTLCQQDCDLMHFASECEGLPRTIKDAGSSLKGKPIEEWKTSLDSLKHSMSKWQIFLSFRGEDTRASFTGYLYKALSQEGFKTFLDDGALHTGDQISPTLTNAIEASRLSIVVLSENYASSTWYEYQFIDKILEDANRIKSRLQIRST
nr:nodulation protein [Melilotus officinalis]